MEIKTSAVTDFITAIYGKDLKLYLKAHCDNKEMETGSVTHFITVIYSKDMNFY